MELKLCPKHKIALVPNETKYGTRFHCRQDGCTVVCWDGSTSTPADYETRQARMLAHAAFDQLWRSGLFTRKTAYKKLSVYLGLKPKDTHIGLFDAETACKAKEFARGLLAV
ncbi:hypothetical protein LCGC14_1940770 [marine sediment metagenome]|uniref:Uncharacterized protein n=1 Tax=marine sediment metagenome TaxID=412755 RepID=A0A0F9G8X8_9ZZZZ